VPVEAYVVPEYFPTGSDTSSSPGEIIRTLAGIRRQPFENISWTDVYKDIEHADKLYEFDTETQKLIAEFVDYQSTEETTKLELQKALAATILRISKLFIEEDQQKKQVQTKGYVIDHMPIVPMTFGNVLHAVAQRPGCAGGGKNSSYQSSGKTLVESLTTRIGTTTQEWFRCPKCEYKADGPIGNTCPGCGITKETFAEETGIVCD
jgi:hypothetical protein